MTPLSSCDVRRTNDIRVKKKQIDDSVVINCIIYADRIAGDLALW
jgi:hypothetical protein